MVICIDSDWPAVRFKPILTVHNEHDGQFDDIAVIQEKHFEERNGSCPDVFQFSVEGEHVVINCARQSDHYSN